MCLMNKICQRVFFVEVDAINYVVKSSKIDEFISLFLDGKNFVLVRGTSNTVVNWSHEYEWYKRIG